MAALRRLPRMIATAIPTPPISRTACMMITNGGLAPRVEASESGEVESPPTLSGRLGGEAPWAEGEASNGHVGGCSGGVLCALRGAADEGAGAWPGSWYSSGWSGGAEGCGVGVRRWGGEGDAEGCGDGSDSGGTARDGASAVQATWTELSQRLPVAFQASHSSGKSDGQ